MVYYKRFTIYYLGLNRYKIRSSKGSITLTDTFEDGLKEVIEFIDTFYDIFKR